MFKPGGGGTNHCLKSHTLSKSHFNHKLIILITQKSSNLEKSPVINYKSWMFNHVYLFTFIRNERIRLSLLPFPKFM